LTEKLALLEAENEKMTCLNEALKEVDAKLVMFDELQERFSSTLAEKEEAAEKLAVHERTISQLTEVHTRTLELHSVAESKNEEIGAQFLEALETISQKEGEVKESCKKLDAL
jgi:golgin subfamily A member 4